MRRDSFRLKNPPSPGSDLLPSLGRATFRALFYGVEGAPEGSHPSEWARDTHEIVHQRLAGLALAAARSDGVQLDPTTESQLQQQRDTDMVRSLAAEVAAPAAIRALRDAGIPAVITKGPGIARSYPIPSLRPFRDIDVLVPPARFSAAKRLLEDLGFHGLLEREGPRPYFLLRCREAVNLFREDGTTVDLHHHVPPWIWGQSLSFSRVHGWSQELTLAGGAVPAAHPVHNLMIASLHVISDGGHPGQTPLIWRDVVAMAGACDPGEAEREARSLGLDWCLAMVLRALPQFARPHDLLERLREARPGPGDRFRLRHLLPPAIGSRHLVGQALCLPLPNAAAFMAGYLVPSRAFLQRRYGSTWAYGRWWREAFGRFREAQTLP